MTIKTLKLIHELLQEECRNRKDDYLKACDDYKFTPEDDAAGLELIRKHKKVAFGLMSSAQDALEEFEAQEWRREAGT